ncbi:hypothetical protein Tdes44962_MAKER07975 [Teratosphaeria destructans]|uniref:Uncharacterized protein n=1 Tax=Teratosphaeria destructans TaxID=418781 RepID=A0A9W7W539_9PEZI|nr:hypothetical protein Tdes44962_MAKER07975 [Teratosphaeria destructans]
MSSRSPKDRLARFFRRSGSHHQDDRDLPHVTPSPPTTPPISAPPQRPLRRSTSRKSIRDAFLSRVSGAGARHPCGPILTAPPASPAGDASRRRVAATKAMNGDRPHRIPSVPRESDLSTDLRPLTLSSSEPGHPQFSEDVADRNIARREAEEILAPALQAGHGAREKRRDMGTAAAPDAFHPPASGTRRRSLSRKPDVTDFRRGSIDTGHAAGATSPARTPRQSVDHPPGMNRSTLSKPLPRSPSDEDAEEFANDPVLRRQSGAPDLTEQLQGIIDLSNTEDFTVHERYAPAVTHETIERRVHEIREERITREIHNHHVFHRVLPIIDIEVLPARHFVPVEGGYAEISEDEVPGRAGPNAQWVIAETVSKLLPESRGPVVPTEFTARTFEGTDGDFKEYVGEDGVRRTETWWVHLPTLEDGGRQSGQTYPFHIGFPNPDENGLQARLPEKTIIGVSPLLAQQQQRQRMSAAGRRSIHGPRRPGPPVPQHQTAPVDPVDARHHARS